MLDVKVGRVFFAESLAAPLVDLALVASIPEAGADLVDEGVAAAVRLGLCAADEDVTVKVRGGDLVVRVSAEGITLTGETGLVFEGVVYA